MAEGFITRKSGGGTSKTGIPEYVYTGNNFIKPVGKDGTGENALWLTSSGVINFPKNVYADIYLVGGGGAGGYNAGSGGGGGGYTYLKNNIFIPANTNFTIDIGQGGKYIPKADAPGGYGSPTVAFGFFASGGYGGGGTSSAATSNQYKGGSGGSGGGRGAANKDKSFGGQGGVGGSNGYINSTLANISIQTPTGAVGQGNGTTYLFNDPNNVMVSYGGAGGSGDTTPVSTGTDFISNRYPNGLSNLTFGSGGHGGIITSNQVLTEYTFTGTNGQDGVVVMKFKSRQNFPIVVPSIKYSTDNTYITSAPYVLTTNGQDDWQLKFLSSGYFKPSEDMTIDAFLVGGGGGGGSYVSGGGAGGYTKTGYYLPISSTTDYFINIGSGGEPGVYQTAKSGLGETNTKNEGQIGQTTTAFNLIAPGGSGGLVHTASRGGIGGSGGGRSFIKDKVLATNGGFNGASSTGVDVLGGKGQNFTTHAFANDQNELYAGGGGGGSTFMVSTNSMFGQEGLGGGGRGGVAPYQAMNGINSFGGGGGGGGKFTGGRGGDGTVIIRPTQMNTPTLMLNTLQNDSYYYRNSNTITFINSTHFTTYEEDGKQIVDIFLVGGGAGGAPNVSTTIGGGGGGGGYTRTVNNVELMPGYTYTVNIGAGGNANENGQITTLSAKDNNNILQWEIDVGGGLVATGQVGGAGGSSGGDGTTSSTKYPGFGGSNGEKGYAENSDSTQSNSVSQGYTTTAFEENKDELYAGGGAGGSVKDRLSIGGMGGGGSTTMPDGIPNTGGGGAGKILLFSSGGKGGSGVLMLRRREIKNIGEAEAFKALFAIGQITEKVITDADGQTKTIQYIEEDNNCWTYTASGALKILSNCYLLCKAEPNKEVTLLNENDTFLANIDIFLAGGGGAGGVPTDSNTCGAGGGGGYTKNIYKNAIYQDQIYKITIGTGGIGNAETDEEKNGSSTIIEYYGIYNSENQTIEKATEDSNIFTYEAKGGFAAIGAIPGVGGSGGAAGGKELNIGYAGGSDGLIGSMADADNKKIQRAEFNQGFSTKPFYDVTELNYCAGGGGAGVTLYGMGGKETGGHGGYSINNNGYAGMAHSGDGGGGAYTSDGIPGNGGSGVVIIKKSINDFNSNFKYELADTEDETDLSPAWTYDQFGIRFLRSGILTVDTDANVDLFLVGGGGGGGTYGYASAVGGGGGGSGYTLNVTAIPLLSEKTEEGLNKYQYEINIGSGGAGAATSSSSTAAAAGKAGGATSIKVFIKDTNSEDEKYDETTYTAKGGTGGNNGGDGGNGGSGGGGGNTVSSKGVVLIGGLGGENGAAGEQISTDYKKGTGSTDFTTPFNDVTSTERFANGGSGANARSVGAGAGAGGSIHTNYNGQDAQSNTGSGGGGSGNNAKNKARKGGDGGSGVLIMRMHKEQ